MSNTFALIRCQVAEVQDVSDAEDVVRDVFVDDSIEVYAYETGEKWRRTDVVTFAGTSCSALQFAMSLVPAQCRKPEFFERPIDGATVMRLVHI